MRGSVHSPHVLSDCFIALFFYCDGLIENSRQGPPPRHDFAVHFLNGFGGFGPMTSALHELPRLPRRGAHAGLLAEARPKLMCNSMSFESLCANAVSTLAIAAIWAPDERLPTNKHALLSTERLIGAEAVLARILHPDC
jgi:hypothetical protein